MTSRYDADRSAVAELLADQPGYRAGQVWNGLYRRLADPADMTDVPLALRQRLAHELPPALQPGVETVSDGGNTVKWLWRLADGAGVETVLMYYGDRTTVCVSSQAGCEIGRAHV